MPREVNQFSVDLSPDKLPRECAASYRLKRRTKYPGVALSTLWLADEGVICRNRFRGAAATLVQARDSVNKPNTNTYCYLRIWSTLSRVLLACSQFLRAVVEYTVSSSEMETHCAQQGVINGVTSSGPVRVGIGPADDELVEMHGSPQVLLPCSSVTGCSKDRLSERPQPPFCLKLFELLLFLWMANRGLLFLKKWLSGGCNGGSVGCTVQYCAVSTPQFLDEICIAPVAH